jgi:lipooligosaccharide transport system permease protein
METMQQNWQGAAKLVDPAVPMRWGFWYVTETRLRNMSKWMAAIIAFGIGNPVLYLFSVGVGIGSLIAGPVDGVSYLAFLAPALLASAAIQAAMDEVSFPTIEGFVWEKTFYAINSTAITGRQIVNGMMVAAMIRAVATVIIYEAILLMFGAISFSAVLPLLLSSTFAGLAFSAVMLAATVKIKDDDGFFAIVGRFIIAPMFMFSGTFYPLENTPIYLQWIGWISPLWHSTDIGRALSYGADVDGWLMIVHFGYLIAMTIGGFAWAYPQFIKRLSE